VIDSQQFGQPAVLRRQLLVAIGAMPIAALASSARASRYPARPVRIVVGFAPGGTADAFARLLAEFATKQLRTAVIVENKAGAAAIVGAEHVAKSSADGYTLLLTFADAMVGNPALYRQLPYKPASDFVPVGLLAQGPLVVSIGKSVPASNLREFVAHARKASISWGSWGAGSHGHLLCEAMNKAYQLTMQHVPYKGEAPTVQGLLGGEIQIAAGSIGVMAPHLKSGALKALGTNGVQPSLTLPQVPTLAEQGASGEAFTKLGWVGLVAPANTPADIVAQWGTLVRDFLALESTRTRFLAYGFEPSFLDSTALRKRMEDDARVWARLIAEAGVRLD